MPNSSESVALIEKCVPITLQNIEIQSVRKGYLTDRIVIHQYAKRTVPENKERIRMGQRCQEIRGGVGRAWSVVERAFPREVRDPLPKPVIPRPRGVVSQVAVSCSKPTPRLSSLSRQRKAAPPPERSPFRADWSLRLTQKGIGALLVAFIHAFDFVDYLRDEGDVVQRCVDFLIAGTVGRILFHVARYFHSVFVMSTEDLPDFLRAVGLWHVMHKRAPATIRAVGTLSIALMAIKSCTSLLFENHVTENERPRIQSALFQAIDDLLNPHHVYESLEKDENFRAELQEFVPDPGKRELESVVHLIDAGAFEPGEAMIARLLLDSETWDQFLAVVGRELWGDTEKDEGSAGTYRPGRDRMVQRLLEWEINRMNEVVPRPPPPWLRDRTMPPP
jgi:hypothetical protein